VKLASFEPGLLRIDRALRNDELSVVERALDALNRFETDQHLFLIAKVNYAELVALADGIRNQLEQRGAVGREGALQIRFELNRRLLNYLASVRSFLDQTQSTLSRRYGNKSAEFASFKASASHEFDTYFHYRFADQLRNYVQHYGFGIDSIRTSVETDVAGSHHATLELAFNRDALLSSGFDWKPVVRNELANGPAEIEVLGLMEQLDGSIGRLGNKRIEIESADALWALRIIQPYIDEIARSGNGTPFLVADDFTQNDGGPMIEFPMTVINGLKASIRQQDV
jgi:hypothetical protein